MRKSSAKPRLDGEQTRVALIEAAGELAAEYGWAHVQAKQVCERAQVNAASVNYWFGGRDALYEAVVAQIPNALIDETVFQRLMQEQDQDKALSQCLDHFLNIVVCKGRTWPMRVWVREVTGNPSAAFLALAQRRGVARIDAMKSFIGSYLGIDSQDVRVSAAIMNMMSVIFLMLTLSPSIQTILYPTMARDQACYLQAIKNQLMLSFSSLKVLIQNEKSR